jgi:pilus assembly protein CpaC
MQISSLKSLFAIALFAFGTIAVAGEPPLRLTSTTIVRPDPAGPTVSSPVMAPVPLELYVGQAHLIAASEVQRIVIGNGKVLQATSLDNGQVLVIPESPGQSTLHLWSKTGGQQAYVINVVAADLARILSQVRALLGGEGNMSARVVGDKIVVEGENLTEEQAARLSEVAKRYPQIVNLVSRLGLEKMIALDVRMLEIRRDRVEQIGVRWNSSMPGPAFSVVGDFHRSGALRPGGAADGVAGVDVRNLVRPFASALGITGSISSMIDLLVQNGDAVVLAEPSLSCRSGGSAKFLAGGELPIPYSSGLGAVSVLFKEYGIRFDVSPIASQSGVISAKIATEISSINFDLVVKDVPGISKRRAETEVNLRENQTLVIAGLIADDSSRSIERVPALGELPVLGQLFRSRAFRDRKTELVVFITPRFVEPMPSRPVAAATVRPERAPAPTPAPAQRGESQGKNREAFNPPYEPWEQIRDHGDPLEDKSASHGSGNDDVSGADGVAQAEPAAQRFQPEAVNQRVKAAIGRIRMLD